MYPDNNAYVYLAWIVKEYIDQHQISCMECPAQSEDLKIFSVWRKRKIDLEKTWSHHECYEALRS